MLQAFTEGADDAMRSGLPPGFPLQYVDIELTNIIYDSGTSVNSWRIGILEAILGALKSAGVVVLEPKMRVEVTVTDEYLGAVLSDLTGKRRAEIRNSEVIGANRRLLECYVPLKELIGYSTEVRSLSRGVASVSIEFEEYGPMGDSEQTMLLNKMGLMAFL